MRVVIPTLTVGSPPALALTMEGLEVTEVVMADRLHYGRLFTELWQAGDGFVLVEHDVVPWPGAITDLKSCPNELCGFEYPIATSMCRSLGCTKFSDVLVQRIPYDVGWQNRAWDELDGAVFATLEVEMHVHHPPVAHVKATSLTLRR